MRRYLEMLVESGNVFTIEMGKVYSWPVEITENPTKAQVLGKMKAATYRQLRGLIDDKGNFYIWDSYYSEHESMMRALTKEGIIVDPLYPLIINYRSPEDPVHLLSPANLIKDPDPRFRNVRRALA